MTRPGDDLRTPLAATRLALLMDDAAAVALRLFFCRQPVGSEAAAESLGCDLLAAVRDCGLLVEDEPERLHSPFHLRIVRDLYLFSDYLGSEPDAVMGAGETTAILFQAGRPDRRVRRALDLGCGAGTLALLLAGDADEVTGTDVNQRAIALARLNASLNGKNNVEFRAGDVYAPVSGEVFDLILSQPPYYPNPAGAAQIFLHGGERGDEVARRVVAGIPEHLAPDGRAVVFTSWPEARKEAASDSLRVVELKTGRYEPHGTRQSLHVVEHSEPGEGWSKVLEVAADCWANVRSRHIDQIIAAEELIRGDPHRLLAASLRLPEGAVPLREGSQMLLDCPPDSLLGLTPVDDDTWDVISAVNGAPDVRSGIEALKPGGDALAIVERALRRGLLTVAGPASP